MASDADEIRHISWKTLSCSVSCILPSLSFGIVYAVALSRLSVEAWDLPETRWWMVYMVQYMMSLIPAFADIGCNWKYLGRQFTEREWKRISWYDSKISWIFRWGAFSNLITGWYFTTKFVPIRAGYCPLYTNENQLVCVSLQMISVFTLISTAILGLTAFFLLCFGTCMLISRSIGESPSLNMPQVISNYVSGFIPISLTPPDNQICVICACQAQPGESWAELGCHHKYHPVCIKPWLEKNPTCPLCRQVELRDPRNLEEQQIIVQQRQQHDQECHQTVAITISQ